MKKYKVGDKVKIKKNAPGANEDYPYVFSSTMREMFGGRVMTIKKIMECFANDLVRNRKFYNGDDCAYYMEEDRQVYTWHSSMFDEEDVIEDVVMAEQFEIKRKDNFLPRDIPCIVFNRHYGFVRSGTITKVDDTDLNQPYEVDRFWIDTRQLVMPNFKELLNSYESLLYESDVLGVVTITKSDNPDYPLNVKLEDGDELELTIDGKMFKNALRPMLL